MRRGESGSGLVSTTTGVSAFLMFLLLAVQVSYNLYATTMVTAAAADAARRAAGSALIDDPALAERTEAWARDLLGDYGDDRVETVHVTIEGGQVAVRVVARNPSFLPSFARRPLGFDRIDRTARVRIERLQP